MEEMREKKSYKAHRKQTRKVSASLSVITLNVNGLNSPTKNRFSEWIKKNLLVLINKFSKPAGFKINAHEKISCFYTLPMNATYDSIRQI